MATTATQNIERLMTQEHVRTPVPGVPPSPIETLYAGSVAFIDATTGVTVSTSNAGANVVLGIVSKMYDENNPPPPELDVVHAEIGHWERIPFAATPQQVGLVLGAVDDATFAIGSGSRLGIIRQRLSATEVYVEIDPVA